MVCPSGVLHRVRGPGHPARRHHRPRRHRARRRDLGRPDSRHWHPTGMLDRHPLL